MNQVIAGYFDDAHRGLQKQRPDHNPRAFVGVASQASNVAPLPPLRADSPTTSMHDTANGGSSWHQGSTGLGKSNSTGALEFTSDQASRGVQDQQYQQALQENSRLSRKLRVVQDQLSITTAKKEAFRAQAMRLEKEFKKGREQTDVIQKELLEAKRDAESTSKESTEAVQMMSEMRKAHLQEVRLLQRGLEARGNDEKFRNRVNEVADLVDKLGRSVVQRDEAIRDKSKAQAQMNKMVVDLRALADECSKLRRQNKNLDVKLKESVRRGKAVAPPVVDRAVAEFDESDEEFETELLHFEKRFQILEEGPMGLDILASNLARDKRMLEKALRQLQDAHRAALASLEEWKALNAQKDDTITKQNQQIEEMMMAEAALQEEIERKRREVEEAVNSERANLEARLAELQNERDEARAAADSMVLASDTLSQQLVKVHEQYDDATKRKQAEKAEMSGGGGMDEPEAEDGGGEWTQLEDPSAASSSLKVKTNDNTEAPVVLKLSVWKQEPSGRHQLRAEDESGNETRITIKDSVLEDLDKSEPEEGSQWNDLFTRVGITSDDPPKVVMQELIGEKEASLPPNGVSVLCRIHRFDAWRYYISGTSLATSFMADFVLTKDDLQTDDDVTTAIKAGKEGDELVSSLLQRMNFKDEGDGGDGFYFGEQ
jgi:hypothetical protein